MTVAQELDRLASAAHGLVTRAQLLDAGVTARQIDRRLRSGGLLRVHPGLYRVGHAAPSVEATYLAAVFAAGEGARGSPVATVPRTLVDIAAELSAEALARACHEAGPTILDR